MKLSAKFLKNVENVNSFQYVPQWDISEGSAQSLYFQIIDKQKEDIRYMPQDAPITVKVFFLSIDDDQIIEKTATQPFTDDKSIWKIDLLVTDVPNSGAVKFSVDENGTTVTFKVSQAIVVDLLDNGGC